ncbi:MULTISPECIES: PaaI family thioesterase [Lactococcus]|uniref:PaaI family thioesterase n=1 Tax=Lactococcus TaxID=1357 RepID=UPI0025514620|nr:MULTISPECIES: PaaI family thioesterase [Lactococcus]
MNLIEQLGIQKLVLTPKGFTAQMPLGDFHTQPQGFLNGGATLAFAEVAAGMASNLLLDDKHFAVGQAVNGNHLTPTKAAGILFAQGLLLRKGGRTHVWELKFTDAREVLVAQVTVTNAIVAKRYE